MRLFFSCLIILLFSTGLAAQPTVKEHPLALPILSLTGGTFIPLPGITLPADNATKEKAGGTTKREAFAVDVAMPPVTIRCGTPTFDSIRFEWDPIPGVIAYNINLDGVVIGNQVDTQFVVRNLLPGDSARLIVTPVDAAPNPDNTPDTLTCFVRSCPDISLDLSANPTEVCIAPGQPPILLMANVINGDGMGTLSWRGPGLTGAIFNPASLGPGTYRIYADYEQSGPCSVTDSIDVVVSLSPTVSFTITPGEVCGDEEVLVEFTGNAGPNAIFEWDFGPGTILEGSGSGPYRINWSGTGDFPISLRVTDEGCQNFPVTTTETVNVSPPLTDLNLSCMPASLNRLDFNWDFLEGADGYQVSLNGDFPQLISDTFFSVDNLLPSDSVFLIVQAFGSTACGNGEPDTLSCMTLGCPELTIDFAPIDTLICLDDNTPPSPLDAMVTGGSGINARQRWSGPGVDPVTNTFFPEQLGAGTYWLTLSYSEKGPCGIIDSIQVRIFTTPSDTFTLNAEQICLGDTAFVEYVGEAGLNADFRWDFSSADTVGNNPTGPIGLIFDQPGVYSLNLTVSENGCTSTPDSAGISLTVVEPLPPAELRCGPAGLDSVTFAWGAIPNVDAYRYLVDVDGTGFTIDSNLTVNNLLPGDSIELTVIPVGTFPCGDGPPSSIVCYTQLCPDFSLVLSASDTAVCLQPGVGPVTLDAVISGGIADQSLISWSGTGISAGTNQFDPIVSGVGDFWLTATYVENMFCSITDSILVRVFPEPIGTLSFSAPTICVGEELTLSPTGNAGPTAIFEWTTPNATVLNVPGNGPLRIRYDAPGLYPVGLTVTENGCISAPPSPVDSILVVGPPGDVELSCGPPSFTTISVDWPALDEATGYRILNLGTNETTEQTSPGLLFTDLGVDSMLAFVVTPLTDNACGTGGSDTIVCSTLPCPNSRFDLSGITDGFCFTGESDSIPLPERIFGEDQGGTFEWAGVSVRQRSGGYFFFPQQAGIGSHDLTVTYQGPSGCRSDSIVRVQVFPPPRAVAGRDGELDCRTTTIRFDGTASTGTGMLTYQWESDNPESIISNPRNAVIEAGEPGNYTLTVIDENGCRASDVARVTLDREPPTATLEILPISCHGADDGVISVLSVDSGRPPFQFSLNNRPVPNGFFPRLGAGSYSIDIVDAKGCIYRNTINLTEPDPLRVRLESDDDLNAIPEGNPVDILARIRGGNPVDTIIWLPEDVGTTNFNRLRLVATEERTIEATVIDENGCRASDQVNVNVFVPPPVFIPNAFSPNGDNINDVFFLHSNASLTEEIVSFSIYDRWGERLFIQENFPPDDPNYGWDGMFQGSPILPQALVYLVEVRLTNGDVVMFKGEVILVR